MRVKRSLKQQKLKRPGSTLNLDLEGGITDWGSLTGCTAERAARGRLAQSHGLLTCVSCEGLPRVSSE